MSTRMIVDDSSQLQEVKEKQTAIRLVAKVISYIFHPVFVPVYIILFLLYVQQGVFAGTTSMNKRWVLLQAILMYGFFPLITVFLLKALKFINSIFLDSQRDRIIPFVICNIWYFWIWYVWRNLPGSPKEIVILSMGIFLASAIGLMANTYMKISMHTIAMGVTVSFIILVSITQSTHPAIYISIALFIAGLVCSARLIASDHRPKEIYGGLLAGMSAVAIALLFV